MTRIDPDNGRTLTTFAFQDGAIWPGAITATADAVWVVTRDGNAVSRINPSTSTVDRLIALRGARSLTVANGSVWVGVANSPALPGRAPRPQPRHDPLPLQRLRARARRRRCPLAGRARQASPG